MDALSGATTIMIFNTILTVSKLLLVKFVAIMITLKITYLLIIFISIVTKGNCCPTGFHGPVKIDGLYGGMFSLTLYNFFLFFRSL